MTASVKDPELTLEQKIRKFNELFVQKINRNFALANSVCVHCGMCIDACHYYEATHDPKDSPVYKTDSVRKIYKRKRDWLSRVLPVWTGARGVETEEDLTRLADMAWGSCTMCRRCTINCPMGVDTALLIRSLRSVLNAIGMAPEGVKQVCRDQYEIGNQMGVSQTDYLETIEWLSEEHADDVGDPEARIPMDKEGADVMFVVNPREVKYAPMTLLAAAKIFYAAGENWTMPSVGWDNTNFGLFAGDDALGGRMGRNLFEKAEQLGVKKVVVSECGHGFRATRWESPNWAKMDLAFPVESILETVQRYIQDGRIRVKRSVVSARITYHDPCNLGRSCGLTEEPRFILRHCAENFIEMYPNRADNWCCSGGGGAMSMSEYTDRRLQVAKVKAEQLRATGAEIVTTACHNCIDALADLIKRYQLNMKTATVCEILAQCLVLPEKPKVAVPARRLLERAAGVPCKILIADDDRDARTFIATVCEDNGAVAIQARNGNEAVELARREDPDLITLDIDMPGKHGGEVYETLKDGSSLSKIPVCIITGQPKLRGLIYDRPLPPPEGYLDKPVNEEEILLSLRKILNLTR
jgi:Fe-S oxidoreductase/CheY-like chemotaxis protein